MKKRTTLLPLFFAIFLLQCVHQFETVKEGDVTNLLPTTLLTKFDVTFFVATDLHYWGATENENGGLTRLVNGMNQFKSRDNIKWPSKITNLETNFPFANEKIPLPKGVILTGDLTHYGGDYPGLKGGQAYLDLKWDWDMTNDNPKHIEYPIYIGLGNHDLGTEDDIYRDTYQRQMLSLVKEFHSRANADAKTPISNYDLKSNCYSWDWDNLHCIQTHLYPGITQYGWSNNIKWFKNDLEKYAGDNRPVILFQHYGFDSFSMQENWTTDSDRKIFLNATEGYNIITIFSGHSHLPQTRKTPNHILNITTDNGGYTNDNTNSAQPEFMIANINEKGFAYMGCKVLNSDGELEFVKPFGYILF